MTASEPSWVCDNCGRRVDSGEPRYRYTLEALVVSCGTPTRELEDVCGFCAAQARQGLACAEQGRSYALDLERENEAMRSSIEEYAEATGILIHHPRPAALEDPAYDSARGHGEDSPKPDALHEDAA